jgi:hypothetical protein
MNTINFMNPLYVARKTSYHGTLPNQVGSLWAQCVFW